MDAEGLVVTIDGAELDLGEELIDLFNKRSNFIKQ